MGRKRKNGEGTVRLRKDGRWEGRVVIGYDEKGLPKTKNVLAKTKTECVEKLKALKASIEKPVPNKAKADMPFGDWITFWYDTYLRPDLRENSHRAYDGYLRVHILPRIGNIPLNKLTTNDLQQFYLWLKKDGRTAFRERYGNGLSDHMLMNIHCFIRRALDKAVKENLIPLNPALECKVPTAHRKEMKVLTREEMQRLLIQARYEGYYEVFLLELATGLRLGELMALQWDDLNFTTGELRVNKQVIRTSEGLTVTEPKTKAAVRTVILPPSVLNALKEHRKTVDSQWLFPSPKIDGKPMYPGNVSQRLQKILKHAGCKHVRFHDLRHTFATNALEHGMDIKTLSTIIGHVSSATTLNVYSHVTDDMRKQAAVSIDQGIAKAEPQVSKQAAPQKTMTEFRPAQGKRRKHGTGSIIHRKENLWEGRYSAVMPDGTRKNRAVSGKTEEECEARLAELIASMKAEVAAEKKRLKEERPA